MNKAEARLEAKERLERVPPAERERAAVAIQRRLMEMPEIAAASTVLLYAALPGEIPTHRLARALRGRGVVVTYPRCLDERRLTLHRVGGPDQLRESGRYGILEPGDDCPLVAEEEIDVAFVPGLAFSPDGYRLGRGAGYYDRLLSSPAWRGFRCGVFLSVQEIPGLPRDPWDVRLDAVVTETGVVRS
jgi:5-formyltetrahydrofolate cyclo-ligase